MRIAIVIHDLEILGGAQKVAVVLASLLHQKGHSVTLIVPGVISPYLNDSLAAGVKIRKLRIPSARLWLLQSFIAAVRLMKLFGEFDVINPHNYPAHIWVHWASLLSRQKGYLIWYCQEPYRKLYSPSEPEGAHSPNGKTAAPADQTSFHRSNLLSSFLLGGKHLLDRYFDAKAEKYMNRSLVNSKYSSSWYREIYRRQPTVLYPSIVDSTQTESETNRKTFVVGVISRLEKDKNIQSVIEAMSILLQKEMTGDREICCEIAGEGSMLDQLKALTVELGCEASVRFLGALTDQELSEFYDNCDVLIFVPLNEPFGLVALEASAHGKPVIASWNGGPSEIITDKESGLLVNPRDPAEIARAVLYLYGSPRECVEMGRKGKAIWQRKFSKEVFVAAFEAIVNEASSTHLETQCQEVEEAI